MEPHSGPTSHRGAAPSPYGAVEGAHAGATRPAEPAAARRQRGRRRGRPDGELEIRPPLDTIGYGLIAGVLLSIGVLAQTSSVIATAVVAGGSLIVWVVQSVYVLTGRVRVADDVLEVRLLWKREFVWLGELEVPVHSRVGGQSSLRLRSHGGRHLATLGSSLWGRAAVMMLGQRLGAARSSASRPRDLEAEFPGALGWFGRHQVVVTIGCVIALFAVIGAAVYLGRAAL